MLASVFTNTGWLFFIPETVITNDISASINIQYSQVPTQCVYPAAKLFLPSFCKHTPCLFRLFLGGGGSKFLMYRGGSFSQKIESANPAQLS